ncbi:hypothetical protein HY490_04930 [Candidatus Woesearchaeota archaeon]|nr:hypothetical protein [Candidatus Woesearchaeota archaeon]
MDGVSVPVVRVYNHHRDESTKHDFEVRVNRAFQRFLDRERLDCTNEVKELLAMQSIQGQAQTGLGVFNGRVGIGQFADNRTLIYPNATIDSVIKALGFQLSKIKKQRQNIIDEIFVWVNGVFDEVKSEYSHLRRLHYDIPLPLVNDEGHPLAGIGLFSRVVPKHALNVLRGMYLASCMDSYEWRQKVTEKYGVELGGGECYPVNLSRLMNVRLSLEQLSSRAYSKWDRRMLEVKGVIVPGDQVDACPPIVQGYVRHAVGHGICDDSAVIMAALMHKIPGRREFDKDYALGVLLCDAVDTWDKCTPVIWKGGQDELLGKYIKSKFDDLEKHIERRYQDKGESMPQHVKERVSLNIPDNRVVDFIYAAHTDPERPSLHPDCSQRYFMKLENNGMEMPIVEAHLEFVDRFAKGYRTPSERSPVARDCQAGFKRVGLKGFYSHLTQWFYHLAKKGIIEAA